MIERIKTGIRNQFFRIKFIRALKEEVEFFHKMTYRRPGHYYSPIVDVNSLAPYLDRLTGPPKRTLDGIDFHEDEQLKLLEKLVQHYADFPYRETPVEGYRYHFDNTLFRHSDAVHLFCMLKELRPRRLIEVGSGWSSALMLDTNNLLLDNSVDLTFVEPYPEERLNNLLRSEDTVTLHIKEVQKIPTSTFAELEAGDILFIDSSHVSKTGSDVNYLYFEILPKLKSGVIIHIHDIFHSMEYPEEWILEHNRGWNEIYLLRAFLMFNSSFRIMLFSSHMEAFHRDWYKKNMPLCLETGGQSIWIKKL